MDAQKSGIRQQLEALAAQGKIGARQIEKLLALTTSGFCYHNHWGVGRITTMDVVLARFSIDFPNKPGHHMDLSFAAESLKPLGRDHIYVRKIVNMDELRQMAALNHLELIKLVLKSLGGKATLEQIQKILVPDVIGDDWRKWWEAARMEIKKDGHFVIPAKKTDPIVYNEVEISLQDRLMADFRAAKGLKARLAIAAELVKNLPELTDPKSAAGEAINTLNSEIATHQRTQPATALEAIFVRDDLRSASGLPPVEGEVTAGDIWTQPDLKVAELFEQVPATKHRRMLQSFCQFNPDNWHVAILNSLNTASAKLVSELARVLIQNDHLNELKETLARLISQHQASSELLLWLARERSDTFADILGPEVFRAMLSAIERDQFNERKANKLRDFILSDQSLLVELIGTADIDVIKDLTRALQLSPSFDDMDKRSLLARIVKSYPVIQTLITGEQTARQETHLIVSWTSLERRRQEYNELVQKKIPANSREIAIARSYGDLRENHEYKAAKEMQKLLMNRKAELEEQLLRARGTDFSNVKGDVVSVGTRVRVSETATSQSETFTILGAWDSDPEQNIISYLTPIAQALIGHGVGDEVEFEFHGGVKRYKIEHIAPVFQPAAPLVVPETAPSAPVASASESTGQTTAIAGPATSTPEAPAAPMEASAPAPTKPAPAAASASGQPASDSAPQSDGTAIKQENEPAADLPPPQLNPPSGSAA